MIITQRPLTDFNLTSFATKLKLPQFRGYFCVDVLPKQMNKTGIGILKGRICFILTVFVIYDHHYLVFVTFFLPSRLLYHVCPAFLYTQLSPFCTTKLADVYSKCLSFIFLLKLQFQSFSLSTWLERV